MDRHEPPVDYCRKSTRRFTTLEGWREVRGGLYVAAGSTISSLALDPAYDPEWRILDDRPAPTRLSRSYRSRLSALGKGADGLALGQRGLWPKGQDHLVTTERHDSLSADETALPSETRAQDPFADDMSLPSEEQRQNPFADSNAVEVEKAVVSPVPLPERPFHIFTKRQKWFVIATIGTAGLFSGLSSNIYFPSLDKIARDLNVSLSAVSLTITSYLIIQGISPLFWGSLSDTLGRRPIYIYSFAVYIAANIALSFSPNFAVLVVFRGLQAAGSASTVSIGNGVIQDIATPVERGAFISFYQAIRNFSIAVGPVLGGLLSNFLGFRSIFIFLLIMSSLVLLVIVFFLPETLRKIAGDGSLRLSGIHQPLIRRYTKEPDYMEDPDSMAPRPKVTIMTFLEPLKLLAEKDVLVSLLFGGTVYAVWSMVVASTTGLFKEQFELGELVLGLAFLPNGVGTIVGSAIAGKLMTRDFISFEKAYLKENPWALPPSKNKKDLPADFPIEHARLRHIPWITALFAVATAAYGFTVLPAAQQPLVSRPGWIAVPLVLQFVIAATSNAVFAANTALVADLCPGRGASATAINNLVRCSLGAVGVAVVDAMLEAFGAAATFLGLGMVTITMGVLLALEWSWGMQWRSQRKQTRSKL